MLLSDDSESAIVDRVARPGRPSHKVRVWWNTPEQIGAYFERGAGRNETHICFFADGRAALTPPPGALVSVVPYAFTTPVRRPPPAAPSGIWYAAEVDVSDSCFSGVISSRSTVSSLSDRVWELARSAVAGELSLVEADRRLVEDTGEHGGAHRAALWALRNRVRYLLVDGLTKAFPGRVHLRGNDWLKLGFEAEPTKFRRWRRLAEYHRFRVALDLGSKSTHSWLYPRTADVLAAAGGLVQFDAEHKPIAQIPELGPRRGCSLSDLEVAVDRLLTLAGTNATAENHRLQEAYGALRQDAARQFVAAVIQGGE